MPADHKGINKSYTSLSTEIVNKFTLWLPEKLEPLLLLDRQAMFICRAKVCRGFLQLTKTYLWLLKPIQIE